MRVSSWACSSETLSSTSSPVGVVIFRCSASLKTFCQAHTHFVGIVESLVRFSVECLAEEL